MDLTRCLFLESSKAGKRQNESIGNAKTPPEQVCLGGTGFSGTDGRRVANLALIWPIQS